MDGKRRLALILLAAVLALSGCREDKEPKAGERYIYFANMEGMDLVKQTFEGEAGAPLTEAKEVLKAMKHPQDAAKYQSVIPEGVETVEETLQRRRMDLYWNAAYLEMDKPVEVLCRAAVVQSLVQIEGIDFVAFYVDGRPLTDRDGNQIGYMRAEDFVQNTGSTLNSYKKAAMKLYYANETGDYLVKETVSVRYNSNMLIEKAIVEQLLKGPSDEKERATLPKGTKLLGVTVKDKVCYVNFDEGFLEPGYDMNPQIAVYSLVNSIAAAGNCSQVQITVEGESNVSFQEVFDLSQPIEPNMDIVEEIK